MCDGRGADAENDREELIRKAGRRKEGKEAETGEATVLWNPLARAVESIASVVCFLVLKTKWRWEEKILGCPRDVGSRVTSGTLITVIGLKLQLVVEIRFE